MISNKFLTKYLLLITYHLNKKNMAKITIQQVEEALGGLPKDQIASLLATDPIALLQKTDLADDIASILEKKGTSFDQVGNSELLLRELSLNISKYIRLKIQQTLQSAKKSEKGSEDPLLVDLSGMIDAVRGRILSAIERHGPHLSKEAQRKHSFIHKVTYDQEKQINQRTLANFMHLGELRKQLEQTEKGKIRTFFGDVDSEVEEILPLGDELFYEATDDNSDNPYTGQCSRVDRGQKDMWKSKEVRIAYARYKHMEYIKDTHEGRSVVEGPTTVKLLNEIHSSLYGATRPRVSGPCITGPPGWGKTTALQDYFRAIGVGEAISADIDRMQSSFTQMARPVIDTGDETAEKKRFAEAVKDLSEDDIKLLLTIDPDFFEEISAEAKDVADQTDHIKQALLNSAEGDRFRSIIKKLKKIEKKGFAYGSIMIGLTTNTPVILNEFVQLPDWSFLNGLLEAEPATDEEAGTKPSERAKSSSTKSPKGWFWNTITGDWMRVPANFRICFTANLGSEHGSPGVKPALESRFNGQFAHNELPPNEIVETVIWPRLCSRANGTFLLDDETAYKLHFLATELLPHINRYCRVHNIYFSFALREIILICKDITPEEKNGKQFSLGEAIMRRIIRPTHAKKDREDLLIQMIALFKGMNFLGKEFSAEINAMVPEENERLDSTISHLLSDAPEVAYNADKYTTDEDKFKGRCAVCGVKQCPCHGSDEKKYSEDLKNLSGLLEVGVNPQLLERISEWQKGLVSSGQWNMLLESHFGETSDIKTLPLQTSERKEVEKYLVELVAESDENPEKTVQNLPLINEGLAKRIISKPDKIINEGVRKKWTDHWDSVVEKLNGYEEENVGEGKEKTYDVAGFRDYLTFLTEYIKIDKDYEIPTATLTLISTYIPHIGDSETLVLLYRLNLEDQEVKKLLGRRKGSLNKRFKKQLEGLKAPLYAKAPNLARVGEEVGLSEDEISQISSFDMKFPAIYNMLDKISQLLELKVITMDDVAVELRFAEEQLNAVFREGRLPRVMIPYIRVIKKLSQIKKTNLEAAIKHFLKEDVVVDMPPVREY